MKSKFMKASGIVLLAGFLASCDMMDGVQRSTYTNLTSADQTFAATYLNIPRGQLNFDHNYYINMNQAQIDAVLGTVKEVVQNELDMYGRIKLDSYGRPIQIRNVTFQRDVVTIDKFIKNDPQIQLINNLRKLQHKYPNEVKNFVYNYCLEFSNLQYANFSIALSHHKNPYNGDVIFPENVSLDDKKKFFMKERIALLNQALRICKK